MTLRLLTLFMLTAFPLFGEEVFSFTAKATGIGSDSPLEFILISPESGHGYESIAVSDISVDNIDAGIKALGAQAGHPADPGNLRFWPRGSWLDITATFTNDGKHITVPIGELVTNHTTTNSLRDERWTFTGSRIQTNREGRAFLAANELEPGSILSVYNDHETLIDRAAQAQKGTVYGTLTPSSTFQFKEGQNLTVSIRWSPGAEKLHPMDVEVEVETRGPQTVFRSSMEPLRTFVGFPALWKHVDEVRAQHPNLFLRFLPGREMTLEQIQDVYRKLADKESLDQFRLTAAPQPHLFFQSFLSDPSFREPAARPSQPWELHISSAETNLNLSLRKYGVESRDEQGRPTFTQTDIENVTTDSLAEHLRRGRFDLPVLLIFTPSNLAYGELLDVLAPIREDYDTFYLYWD